MSFARKRGGIWYLYWNVREPDPSSPKGYVWRQRCQAVSPDRATFDEFRAKFDYTRNRTRLGLSNEKMEWADFRASFLPHKKGKNLEIYTDAFRRFEQIAKPGTMGHFTYPRAQAYRAALNSWVSPRTGRTLSDTTKNMDIRAMRAAWAEAKRAGYVAENVFAEIREFKTTRLLPRYLTPDELRRVMDEAKRSEADGAYLMMMVIKYTGIRKSELLNLRWASFDLERGVMFLRASKTWEPKDRAENSIGLHPDLVAALRERKAAAPGDYVFPGQDGGPRHTSAIGHLFNRIYARAGVDARGVHILRHTFATHAGLDPKTLQAVLGHSDPRTTQRYTHFTEAQRDAIRRVNY